MYYAHQLKTCSSWFHCGKSFPTSPDWLLIYFPIFTCTVFALAQSPEQVKLNLDQVKIMKEFVWINRNFFWSWLLGKWVKKVMHRLCVFKVQNVAFYILLVNNHLPIRRATFFFSVVRFYRIKWIDWPLSFQREILVKCAKYQLYQWSIR